MIKPCPEARFKSSEPAAYPRWFHGSRAINRPMLQKSEMPANTRPGPTKPDSQMLCGFTKCAGSTPVKTIARAAMRAMRNMDFVKFHQRPHVNDWHRRIIGEPGLQFGGRYGFDGDFNCDR